MGMSPLCVSEASGLKPLIQMYLHLSGVGVDSNGVLTEAGVCYTTLFEMAPVSRTGIWLSVSQQIQR